MKDFYAAIENILLTSDPQIIQLKSLRNLMMHSLNANDFKLSCVETLLAGMETEDWDQPDFYYHDKLNFSVRMVIWPAFYENNPHQHKTWSVTGVFWQHLKIKTYDLLAAPKRLRVNQAIEASAGQAGFLQPGCIHNIFNPSHQLSASLHIFNHIDYAQPEHNAIWYPAPRKFNLSSGALERAMHVGIAVCRNIQNKKSLQLLQRIFAMAPCELKLQAAHAIYQQRADLGKNMFNQVETFL